MGKASEKGTHTFAHIPIRLAQSHRLESEVFVCEPRQVSVLGGGERAGGGIGRGLVQPFSSARRTCSEIQPVPPTLWLLAN